LIEKVLPSILKEWDCMAGLGLVWWWLMGIVILGTGAMVVVFVAEWVVVLAGGTGGLDANGAVMLAGGTGGMVVVFVG
jgi:hypothetical protein